MNRIIATLALLLATACDPDPETDTPRQYDDPIWCDAAGARAVTRAIEAEPPACELECLEDFLGCLSSEGPGVTEACMGCEFIAAECTTACGWDISL